MLTQIILILLLHTAQPTELSFTFLLKSINNTEIENAEYLTERNYVGQRFGSYTTYFNGTGDDQIAYEEYFLKDRSFDYIKLSLQENHVSYYKRLVENIKGKAVKNDIFYNDWHKVYTSKYSLNGVNIYYYSKIIGDKTYYSIYISKLALEDGLFKGWQSEEYQRFYNNL